MKEKYRFTCSKVYEYDKCKNAYIFLYSYYQCGIEPQMSEKVKINKVETCKEGIK